MKNLSIYILLFLGTNILYAQIIQVPADYSTLQAAIDAAVNGDTVLVSDGIYSGDGNNMLELKQKEIVIQSENGPSGCIIDGSEDSYFAFGEGVSYEGLMASVQGFTIRNYIGPGFYYFGGSCPNIKNNIIENCKGGGIIFREGSPSIENNLIRDNTGPAIDAMSCSARIVANTITDNYARNGAGIHLMSSSAYILNNIIAQNHSEKYGGGLYLKYDSSVVANNTIVKNTAESGGGIYVNESFPTLTNNIIARSENFLSAAAYKLEEWRETNLAVTYSYCGGILCGATLYEGFINKGPAGDITIHVWDFGDTTIFVDSFERYSIIIKCAVQSDYTTTMVSSVVSDFDTLKIESYFQGKHLATSSVKLISHGVNPVSGITAVDCEAIDINHCTFFNNSGGDYFNFSIDTSSIDLSETDGNMVCDPGLNEADYSLTAQSDCIDKGIADTSGLRLPDTDIVGTKRILDGNNDGLTLIDIGAFEFFTPTGINSTRSLANNFKLFQNYPNPFNPITVISYELRNANRVNISILNIKGQKLKTLIDGKQSAGIHSLKFDASDLSSGVYIYKLTAGQFEKSRKMILIR